MLLSLVLLHKHLKWHVKECKSSRERWEGSALHALDSAAAFVYLRERLAWLRLTFCLSIYLTHHLASAPATRESRNVSYAGGFELKVFVINSKIISHQFQLNPVADAAVERAWIWSQSGSTLSQSKIQWRFKRSSFRAESCLDEKSTRFCLCPGRASTFFMSSYPSLSPSVRTSTTQTTPTSEKVHVRVEEVSRENWGKFIIDRDCEIFLLHSFFFFFISSKPSLYSLCARSARDRINKKKTSIERVNFTN